MRLFPVYPCFTLTTIAWLLRDYGCSRSIKEIFGQLKAVRIIDSVDCVLVRDTDIGGWNGSNFTSGLPETGWKVDFTDIGKTID